MLADLSFDKELWLMQALSTIMRALGCVHHALYACRPSLHVDGIPPFLVNLQLGVNNSVGQLDFVDSKLHILAGSKKAK